MQIIEQVESYFLQTDYERIEERGWGCLNPNSPVPGLCTDLVGSCFVFVFHCNANGRTTLCHAVSGTDLRAFEAQMRYVAGESPHPVDIIVFRGWAYGIPGFKIHESDRCGCSRDLEDDLAWASQTVERIKDAIYGLVLVEKSTGKITLPIRPRAGPYPTVLQLQYFSSSPTPAAMTKREVVDAFYRIQSTTLFISSNFTRVPCFEVYDGARRLPIPPSSDDMREIFRIATMHPNYPDLEPIQYSDFDIVKRLLCTEEISGYVKGLSPLLRDVGAFCEVAECRQFTMKRCPKCKGAYYCGDEHQNADWEHHKGWCKSHRQKPGAATGEGEAYNGTLWM
ncbi:hypothetical protein C8J57DRAFT_1313215 [Mycena rebaudengoi]|nr:hypothetical protein C8J57DRAFT_1313215 [Mycena rebaudengoi]